MRLLLSSMHVYVSMCQVRNIPFEEQSNLFSWSLAKGFIFLRRRKNQFKTLLEMCFAEHFQAKSVFSFQPTKLPSSTTVKKTKPSFTFWIFHLRTKNQKKCCSVVIFVIFCKKDVSWLWKRKTISSSEETYTPITAKHIRTWARKPEIIPFMA